MGKYVEAQLLSLADPSKTDSPLKAIGDGMINVAKYHKQWMLDKIQDKLANNELDLSNIKLNIAKATENDKIEQTKLDTENKFLSNENQKTKNAYDKKQQELYDLYGEKQIQQALANQKAQANNLNANASATTYKTQNSKALDMANTYIVSVLNINPELGNLEPKDAVSFIARDLMDKINQTADEKQKQNLKQTLQTVNQFGLQIIGNISKADELSINASQNRDIEKQRKAQINQLLINIDVNNTDEYYQNLPKARKKLAENKELLNANGLSNEDKEILEKQNEYLKEYIDIENKISDINTKFNLNNKNKTKKDNTELSMAEREKLKHLHHIDTSREFIRDFEKVLRNLGKKDLGITSQALPSNIKWGLGITEKSTPTYIYQKYLNALKLRIIQENKSGKSTVKEVEALLNMLPKDAQDFGNIPPKAFEALAILDKTLYDEGIDMYKSVGVKVQNAYKDEKNNNTLSSDYDNINSNLQPLKYGNKTPYNENQQSWENMTD